MVTESEMSCYRLMLDLQVEIYETPFQTDDILKFEDVYLLERNMLNKYKKPNLCAKFIGCSKIPAVTQIIKCFIFYIFRLYC